LPLDRIKILLCLQLKRNNKLSLEFATVQNKTITVNTEDPDGTRFIVKLVSLDSASEGQINLLRMWLRIISEETGHNWRKIYADSCFACAVDSEVSQLKKSEIQEILKDLESLASELELKIPFPTKWDRKSKLYGLGGK
jgi:hypothetical protein